MSSDRKTGLYELVAPTNAGSTNLMSYHLPKHLGVLKIGFPPQIVASRKVVALHVDLDVFKPPEGFSHTGEAFPRDCRVSAF